MLNFNTYFSKAHNTSSEYCASIIKLDKISPIEGADNIGVVYVNFTPIIIRKDQFIEGEYYFYAPNESELCEKFLSANNLYDIQNYELNSNSNIVKKYISEGLYDAAQANCGFFNKYGRVRTIKLRGQQSFGFLFSLSELKTAFPDIDIDYIDPSWKNFEFDTIYGTQFIKPYIPRPKYTKLAKTKKEKDFKKEKGFDRLIPGQFSFHYDTKLFNKYIYQMNGDTEIVITPKIHGTSAIFGNILTKKPICLPIYKKILNQLVNWKFLCNKYYTDPFEKEYSLIYSSRKVIKNRILYKDSKYTNDIWGKFAQIFSDQKIIDKDLIIYGEIVGWSSSTQLIQKQYDYGCKKGEAKFMPYRIVQHTNTSTIEWEIDQVKEWTQKIKAIIPNMIMEIPILYKGTLRNLCSNISNENWYKLDDQIYQNILNSISSNISVLGMEKNEPLCKNKVPREGICIRILNDPIPECFKLKTEKFRKYELKLIDSGESNIEMMENNKI